MRKDGFAFIELVAGNAVKNKKRKVLRNYNNLLYQIQTYPDNYDFKNKIYINYTFINDFNTIPSWTELIIKQAEGFAQDWAGEI